MIVCAVTDVMILKTIFAIFWQKNCIFDSKQSWILQKFDHNISY
jgi:hypothetical protein